MAITGHIGAAVYIGAIALGGTVFNTLYWLFGFLRMGTSGLAAQAFGSGDVRAQNKILLRSLTIGLIIGLLLIALSQPFGGFILSIMDSETDTRILALRYFNICIWGAPAVMLSYGLSGWFLGMQNSKAQMWVAIVTNVVNICVSPALVFGLGWKIEGVAIGTVTAQYVGLAVGIAILLRKFKVSWLPLREVLELKPLTAFFRINSDIFLRTVCLVAVTLWFTHAGALQGTDILAANALLLQLFMLFSYFMDGFAFAGEALAGKYAGRSDNANLHSLVKALLHIGVSFAITFCAIYLLAGEQIVRLLAEDKSVVAIARQYLPWAAAIPLCGFLAFIWDGIFIGLLRTRAMLTAVFTALCGFFIIYLSLRGTLGNDALWAAFNTYLLIRGIVSAILGKNLWLHKTH